MATRLRRTDGTSHWVGDESGPAGAVVVPISSWLRVAIDRIEPSRLLAVEVANEQRWNEAQRRIAAAALGAAAAESIESGHDQAIADELPPWLQEAAVTITAASDYQLLWHCELADCFAQSGPLSAVALDHARLGVDVLGDVIDLFGSDLDERPSALLSLLAASMSNVLSGDVPHSVAECSSSAAATDVPLDFELAVRGAFSTTGPDIELGAAAAPADVDDVIAPDGLGQSATWTRSGDAVRVQVEVSASGSSAAHEAWARLVVDDVIVDQSLVVFRPRDRRGTAALAVAADDFEVHVTFDRNAPTRSGTERAQQQALDVGVRATDRLRTLLAREGTSGWARLADDWMVCAEAWERAGDPRRSTQARSIAADCQSYQAAQRLSMIGRFGAPSKTRELQVAIADHCDATIEGEIPMTMAAFGAVIEGSRTRVALRLGLSLLALQPEEERRSICVRALTAGLSVAEPADELILGSLFDSLGDAES